MPPNSILDQIKPQLLLACHCAKRFWDVKLSKTLFIVSALKELYTVVSLFFFGGLGEAGR